MPLVNTVAFCLPTCPGCERGFLPFIFFIHHPLYLVHKESVSWGSQEKEPPAHSHKHMLYSGEHSISDGLVSWELPLFPPSPFFLFPFFFSFFLEVLKRRKIKRHFKLSFSSSNKSKNAQLSFFSLCTLIVSQK